MHNLVTYLRRQRKCPPEALRVYTFIKKMNDYIWRQFQAAKRRDITVNGLMSRFDIQDFWKTTMKSEKNALCVPRILDALRLLRKHVHTDAANFDTMIREYEEGCDMIGAFLTWIEDNMINVPLKVYGVNMRCQHSCGSWYINAKNCAFALYDDGPVCSRYAAIQKISTEFEDGTLMVRENGKRYVIGPIKSNNFYSPVYYNITGCRMYFVEEDLRCCYHYCTNSIVYNEYGQYHDVCDQSAWLFVYARRRNILIAASKHKSSV